VVQASPQQVWPVIKDFWQETGFIVNIESPETGVIETDWAENRAKIPDDVIRRTIGKVTRRPVFHRRARQVPHPRRACAWQAAPKSTSVTAAWSRSSPTPTRTRPSGSRRPADPELEAEMLRRLMQRFGVEEQRAATLLAQQQTPEQARVVREAGASILEMDEGFDRAWRRVGLALDRIGFAVEDRDRSKGVYFVRYIDPEVDNASKRDEGMLSKFAFWRGKKEQASPQLQIVVNEAGEKSRVNVTGAEGKAADANTQTRIINLLHSELK
jgi:outer membrane protein assembly factor BamC